MNTLTQSHLQEIRTQFPVLNQQVNGKDLIYLDNAATSQKPRSVIDAISGYYLNDNANIHRGIHTLAERATEAFELTRKVAAEFLGAKEAEEIIFTKGTTDGINLVASSLGQSVVKEGDEIILSHLEHHSNIVPWQLLAERVGAKIKVIPINDKGEMSLDEAKKLFNHKTKVVAINHVSNSLGTINPVEQLIAWAQEYGALTLLDGAQAAPHLDINVSKLNCDFYVCSGHKMYGPTGIGLLYGKRRVLEKLPPYQGGGEMIKDVSFAKTTYNDIPYKFEAGTPNIADVVALKEAFEFINNIGKTEIQRHESMLLDYTNELLLDLPRLKPIGTSKNKVGVFSFILEGIHHFDVGQLLDTQGIAVRTGHHCTQPLMEYFGIEGTIRASYAVYNSKEEVEKLAEGLKKVIKVLGR